MRRLRGWTRRVPRAGWICFVIALLNAVVWGVIVPPFQVPDENAHFAYAQYLAETGKPPPQGAGSQFSAQESTALADTHFYDSVGDPRLRGVLTPADNDALRAALASHPSPVGGGGRTSSSNQPPLYYALAAGAYWLSPSSNILARLAVMRLLSALLAACTVLTVFLFLRELLPGTPWAWTVGALAVTFQPVVSFIAAGVQGDNLLYLVSALTFLLLLRAYRRGLTTGRAVAIGAITAAGVLSKLTFIALLPGIALAVLLLGWRERPRGRLEAVKLVAIAVAVAVAPIALYALLNVTVWDRGSPLAGGVSGAVTGRLTGGGSVTLAQSLDYTWELYLPKLPFMHHDYFPGPSPLIHVWLNGTIGRFGWLDYGFPSWVYAVGRDLLYVFLALAVLSLIQVRDRIRPLLPIFACFAVMALGLLGAIGYSGIRYQLSTGSQFAQARYLFPLLVLYGLFVVLVARGVGRRWAPVLGAALIVLAMAHGLFAETLTISRYYG